MKLTAAQLITPQTPAHRFFFLGSLLTLSLAAALLTAHAQAQTADAAATAPAEKASQAASAAVAAAPAATPKYSEKDIERAFRFMDKNGDGKISREEAAGFRGVAKHFDEADTDKDNALSLKEFERAMNGPKP